MLNRTLRLPFACGQDKAPTSDARWGKRLRRADRGAHGSDGLLHEGKYRDDAVSPQIAARR
jgi:hypothetical protein